LKVCRKRLKQNTCDTGYRLTDTDSQDTNSQIQTHRYRLTDTDSQDTDSQEELIVEDEDDLLNIQK